MSIFDDQALFMQDCGQTVSSFNFLQANMYLKLIQEEYEELLCAKTEVDAADAIIDILVVVVGYGLSRGWPMQELWDEVMKTNFAKVAPETGRVRRREDGKVLKPEGWKPPNIEGVLRASRDVF
jgi:predicted HAD superfamily Cof-like phosphohydrolase